MIVFFNGWVYILYTPLPRRIKIAVFLLFAGSVGFLWLNHPQKLMILSSLAASFLVLSLFLIKNLFVCLAGLILFFPSVWLALSLEPYLKILTLTGFLALHGFTLLGIRKIKSLYSNPQAERAEKP